MLTLGIQSTNRNLDILTNRYFFILVLIADVLIYMTAVLAFINSGLPKLTASKKVCYIIAYRKWSLKDGNTQSVYLVLNLHKISL